MSESFACTAAFAETCAEANGHCVCVREREWVSVCVCVCARARACDARSSVRDLSDEGREGGIMGRRKEIRTAYGIGARHACIVHTWCILSNIHTNVCVCV